MSMYRSFNFTSIGSSHIKKGTVCQDFSKSIETDNYKLAVISDGHGGADYFRSDRGSRLAVEAFCQCAEEAFTSTTTLQEENTEEVFLQNKAKNLSDALNACKTEKHIEEQVRWFMRCIVTRWNILVNEDIIADPFCEEEMTELSPKAKNKYEKGEKMERAYGATLIGIVLTNDFWFGIHIGDGICVAFDKNGKDCEPIPWDENCFLNVTTSICDSNAGNEFRFFFSKELPAAVFAASDGIDDCFRNTRNLHNFYRTVLTSFATETEETAVKNLSEYLPIMSAKGSADDMSVGCIIDIGHIRDNAALYEKLKVLYLNITRIGNLGKKSDSENYKQEKEIEVRKCIVHLDEIGCCGFGKGVMEFEITSVANNIITFLLNGKKYVIAPEGTVNIRENSVGESDWLIIKCIMK